MLCVVFVFLPLVRFDCVITELNKDAFSQGDDCLNRNMQKNIWNFGFPTTLSLFFWLCLFSCLMINSPCQLRACRSPVPYNILLPLTCFSLPAPTPPNAAHSLVITARTDSSFSFTEQNTTVSLSHSTCHPDDTSGFNVPPTSAYPRHSETLRINAQCKRVPRLTRDFPGRKI